MKCKTKSLYICIALSLLLGCIAKNIPVIPEAINSSFGTLAETVIFQDYIIDLEKTSVSEHEVTSEFDEGDALRHFPQTKRVNNYSSSKYGLSFFKKKHFIYHPILPNPESFSRFPSGLIEARLYLISLGKLTI